jgi:hypothetical protein
MEKFNIVSSLSVKEREDNGVEANRNIINVHVNDSNHRERGDSDVQKNSNRLLENKSVGVQFDDRQFVW